MRECLMNEVWRGQPSRWRARPHGGGPRAWRTVPGSSGDRRATSCMHDRPTNRSRRMAPSSRLPRGRPPTRPGRRGPNRRGDCGLFREAVGGRLWVGMDLHGAGRIQPLGLASLASGDFRGRPRHNPTLAGSFRSGGLEQMRRDRMCAPGGNRSRGKRCSFNGTKYGEEEREGQRGREGGM